MPKVLIIGNDSYDFPIEGENSGYGESVTSWAEAVTDALGTVQSANDIPLSTAVILNNISVPTSVLGFSFNTSEVIAITGEYIVRRSTDTVNQVQSGKIEGNFSGSAWSITHEKIGDAGVSFDISGAGQITYTSSNISGASYSGQILFKARVFNQPE